MRRSDRSTRCVASVCIVASLLSFISEARGVDSTSLPTTAPSAHMSVRVADQAGKPIPRAEVIVETWQGRTTVPTDDSGVAAISYPAGRRDLLRVIAIAPGHTPASAMWWRSATQPDLLPPKEITFNLRPGTRIGGVLLGPEDEPIAGATVMLAFKSADGPERLVYRAGRIEHGPWQIPVTTDADGRWSYDGAPAEWREAFVQPQHPEYYSPGTLTNKKDQRDALREGSDVSKMERGRNMLGRVVDPNGEAVADAHVWVEPGSIQVPAAVTDADGKFEIKQASPRPFRLSITAGLRFAPQVVQVMADDQGGALRIELDRPHILSVEVVDSNGKPVAGAFARVMGWGTDRTAVKDLLIEAADDGRIEFAVPDAPIQLIVVADGYATKVEQELQPGGPPHVIELHPAIRISGTVVDAATGNAIDKFYVGFLPLNLDEDDFRPQLHEATGGKYELMIPQELDICQVRIEAPGYKTADSNDLPINGYQAVFDAALELED